MILPALDSKLMRAADRFFCFGCKVMEWRHVIDFVSEQRELYKIIIPRKFLFSRVD